MASYISTTAPSTGAGQAFAFNVPALLASHIFLLHNGAADVAFVISGTSGAWVVTVTPSINSGDALRIFRKTPNDFAGLLATFAAGTVITTLGLNTALKQILYVIEELRDREDRGPEDPIDQTVGGGAYATTRGITARNKVICDLAAPTQDNDAARRVDIQGIVVAAGNLPSPVGLVNGTVLEVLAETWRTRGFADWCADNGIVTGSQGPAFATIGAAIGNIPTMAIGNSFWAQVANNLSDLANPATARTNLGLGSAATLAAGVLVNNVPQLGAGGQFAAGIGGTNLAMQGNVVYGRSGGALDVFVQVDYGPNATDAAPVNLRQDAAGATDLTPAWANNVLNARNLPATPLSAQLNNTLADVAGTGGAPTVTLKMGKYRVSVRALVKCVTAAEVGWVLYGLTGCTVSGLSHTIDQQFAAGDTVAVGSEGLVVVTAATGTVQLRMASSQADSRLYQANVTFTKVND